MTQEGAITDLTYNSRGLTTQIAYTPNSGGVDTPTVDYTYDNLGNRTSMDTAGVSATAYSYNELSQLTGETVDFDDLSTNLTLGYTYNIGGGLKSVTDPFSQTISYTNDKTGRLTDVGGTTFGDVTSGTTNNYAAGIKYRAFGSVKKMTPKTDDNNVVTMAYDDALRVSEHKATSDFPSGGYMQNGLYIRCGLETDIDGQSDQ
ncbi:MAG: hypothetical protein IPK98_11335 [Chloracidobacterium sp.]|nr:hypothetical protein [Chloracidobacterium sp.]